jgi:hypothetical protein
MKKKVLFIIGSGHCGSTLLTLMLGCHPDCFALGELNSLPNHYKTEIPICNVCQGKCSFWNELDPKELKTLAAVLGNIRIHKYIPLKLEKTIREVVKQDDIFNPYTYLFSQRKESILIDASKAVSWVIERLQAKEFTNGSIEPYLLHLVRDGRAVMSSYLRRFSHMSASSFAEGWADRALQRNRLYEQFPDDRKITISYKNLATQTEETLKSVCQLLGIKFIPETIEFWKYNEHHVISGNSGVRSLIWRAKQEQIEEEVNKYQGNYYDQQGLAIKLDMRWKDELSPEQLEIFESIAGKINRPYEWG